MFRKNISQFLLEAATETSGGTATTNTGTSASVDSVSGDVAANAGASQNETVATQNSGATTAASGGKYSLDQWRDSLPDDLKNESALGPHIKDVQTLAKSFVHAQKMIGADKVVLPSKHATDSDWKEFFRKVGVPETSDKYDIKAPEDIQKDEFFGKFKDSALKAGLLPKQAQEMFDFYKGYSEDSLKAATESYENQRNETLGKLKTEWGQAYDQKMHLTREAYKTLDPELVEFFDKSGLGDHPMVIKAFSKIGDVLLKEGKILGDGNAPMMTPAKALEAINTIMGNMEHPFYNGSHPNHANALNEVMELRKLAGQA